MAISTMPGHVQTNSLKSARDAMVLGVLNGVLGIVSRRRRASLVHRLSRWEPIDYSGKRIEIRVASKWEYNRLNPCEKEPETLAWIERVAKPGEVFYDIGANVGSYGLIAASLGCKVIAFEPVAANHAAICANAGRNKLAIQAFNLALGEGPGIAGLNLAHDEPGTTCELGDAAGSTESVLIESLDTVIETWRLPQPTHIKLDVDGFEAPIVAGASRTLSNPALRSILVELEPGTAEGDGVVAALEQAGLVLKEKHNRKGGILQNMIFERS